MAHKHIFPLNFYTIEVLLVNERNIDFEIERIKKDIEFLKNECRNEKNYEYNKASLLKYNLIDKERMVIEYIRGHPGTSTQRVVEHFNGESIPGLSRNPIFNIIKSLIEREYLIKEKDRHNKNTHKLFLNERNVVLSVSDEIDGFKNIFLELLKNPNLVNIKNDNDKKEILTYIDQFYSKIISIYIFRALPAFRKMINHKQILYELYNIVSSNVNLLQEKYYEFNNPIQTSYFMDAPLYIDICTDDDDYDRKIELFTSNGMQDQIILLLKFLDGINYRYAKQHRILAKEI